MRRHLDITLGICSVVLLGPLSQVKAYDEPQDRYLPPVQTSGWELGVGVKNNRGGCTITRVLPTSAAKVVGLEVGDIILSVNGVPVGFTGGALNDLEDELNRQADSLGRVTLRIRNGRNGQLTRVPVRLTPAQAWRPPVVEPPPWWEIPRPPRPPQEDTVAGTINILYEKYLGRRPDRQGMQNWLTQVANGMRIEEVHANILASAEYFDRCGNNEERWVTQLYRLTAGRRPTPQEVQNWLVTLANFHGQRLPLSREFLRALGQY